MTHAILAVSSTPPVTGQSLAGDMLLRALRRSGASFSHLDLSRGTTIRSGPIDSLRRAKDALSLCLELRAELQRHQRPVFYLHLGQSAPSMVRDSLLLSIARRRRARLVVHVHGGGFRDALELAPTVIRHGIESQLKHVESAIVLSGSLRSMFDEVVPRSRIHVISNGIEDQLVKGAPPPTRRAPGEPLRVLHLSNLIPSKGYVRVLRLAQLAQSQGLNLEFTLAGPLLSERDPHPDRLIDDLRLSNAEWIGPVDIGEKRSLLESHHAFLFPSLYPVEGQPLAVLEAMHYAMPVLATKQGGLPDVVTERVGWCLEYSDAAFLSRLQLL